MELELRFYGFHFVAATSGLLVLDENIVSKLRRSDKPREYANTRGRDPLSLHASGINLVLGRLFRLFLLSLPGVRSFETEIKLVVLYPHAVPADNFAARQTAALRVAHAAEIVYNIRREVERSHQA
ncbi:MAG: hypothetical protein IKL96_03075 [Kiritimatiellae bacterium]|nr:hypothetical protein [Kiritimatiellia bacterium]